MTSTLVKFSSLPRLNCPKIHRLPNGLTIIAEQMPVEAVNLSIWANVGSAVESDEINGMAHFLEHMVFKGTQRLESGEFERRIEERGAVTNAATSQDYTHYYITSAPQDFAELAPLQIDVVLNPSIPEDGFERERLVVLEEIRRSEDNPRRRIYSRAMETAFERLPYRRPVLGPTETIAGLKAQQMRDFHGTWYQPRSLTAVAVGNLPVEQLIEIVAEGFEKNGRPAFSLNPNWQVATDDEQLIPESSQVIGATGEPAFQNIVRREFIDDKLQQARLVMMWRVPGLTELNNTYALDAIASILGRGRMGRLVQDLREEKGLVSGISVSNSSFHHQGIFTISAHLPSENLEKVEAAIQEHLRRFHREVVRQSEIDRIVTQVVNRFIFSNETPSDRANLYGYYHSLMGDLEPAFNYPTHLQSLTPEDIQQAALDYLSAEAYGVVTIKPAV
ncbi:M16 family metallopeptidase [Laspinema olomoucense]|uniref:M16 family metallopeptidase n=1 Tax=Laspinema olomoucense TaxID=3231600 RepID=UPI0021BB984E|nr:pitrilysin family protein [Laspinema sp. D3d]MCT7974514.1 insulinase family protein [Laspinema sp. D3d]